MLIDMTNKRFGKLIVIKRAGSKNSHATWHCMCECGKFVVVRGAALRSGSTKSCGCSSHPFGKHNARWRGDNVGYFAAHKWLRKNKPKVSNCEQCGEKKRLELSYQGKSGKWSRNFNDYIWLCRSCHLGIDLAFAPGPSPCLTKHQSHRLREFYMAGAGTQNELAKLFQISRRTIARVINKHGVYANI